MEEKLELVVRDEDGKVALSTQVETILDICEEACNDAQLKYNKIKEAIMLAMLDNKLKSATVGKYKLSIREPKEKWNFDADRFIEEENEDIVVAFSSIEKTTTETFDMEAFKKECPEIYAKYLLKKTEEKIVVDEHKLWSTLRNVWEKYATKEEAKPITFSIKKSEE